MLAFGAEQWEVFKSPVFFRLRCNHLSGFVLFPIMTYSCLKSNRIELNIFVYSITLQNRTFVLSLSIDISTFFAIISKKRDKLTG